MDKKLEEVAKTMKKNKEAEKKKDGKEKLAQTENKSSEPKPQEKS